MPRLPRTLAFGAALALTTVSCAEDGPDAVADVAFGRVMAHDPPETTEGGVETTDGGVTIVAKDLAFDITTLNATVGETLTITYQNSDDGIPHNLHVAGTVGGDAATAIEVGPTTQTLEVTFDRAGEFEYLCDVHPVQMRGTITVSP